MRGELVMNIFSKIKNKLISLFRPAKNQHRPTEHGNILIEKQPEEDEIRQIEHLAKHARKRRVRKKNQRRLERLK